MEEKPALNILRADYVYIWEKLKKQMDSLQLKSIAKIFT